MAMIKVCDMCGKKIKAAPHGTDYEVKIIQNNLITTEYDICPECKALIVEYCKEHSLSSSENRTPSYLRKE